MSRRRRRPLRCAGRRRRCSEKVTGEPPPQKTEGPERPARALVRYTKRDSARNRHPGAREPRHVFLIDPAALDVARLPGAHEEPQVGVGRDAGAHRGPEDFDPAVAALEAVNDVARRLTAQRIIAKPGFHRVLDKDAHLDEIAAPGFARNLDSRRHRVQPPSRQADSLTAMSAASNQKLPSESCATAVTRWVPFKRTRDSTSARPMCGPRKKLVMSATGFFSETRSMRRT